VYVKNAFHRVPFSTTSTTASELRQHLTDVRRIPSVSITAPVSYHERLQIPYFVCSSLFIKSSNVDFCAESEVLAAQLRHSSFLEELNHTQTQYPVN